MIKHKYFLVSGRYWSTDHGGFVSFLTSEPIALTVFAVLEDKIISLPSGRECFPDDFRFEFKELTKAEFETYLEFEVLPNLDSDIYSIPLGLERTLNRTGTIFG